MLSESLGVALVANPSSRFRLFEGPGVGRGESLARVHMFQRRRSFPLLR